MEFYWCIMTLLLFIYIVIENVHKKIKKKTFCLNEKINLFLKQILFVSNLFALIIFEIIRYL